MSVMTITELRKISDEIGRSQVGRLRSDLADLLSVIERGKPSAETTCDQIRAILEGRYEPNETLDGPGFR